MLIIAEGGGTGVATLERPPHTSANPRTLKVNPETLDKQLCAITRAESQKVARQEREDEEAEVQDGALLRTAEPDQPKPTLPDQSHAPPASNSCAYQPQAWWLSKLDLNKGFYQIPLVPESFPKTAFCSPWWKFAFT